MRLITGFEIENFRSIRQLGAQYVMDFSAFAGQNNSGKSNVFRALNLFFNDEIENGVRFDLNRDFNKHRKTRKQKQKISVEVQFELPKNFKFRKELYATQKLLGTKSFKIRKEWAKDPTRPNQHLVEIFFNGKQQAEEDKVKIEQFLSLIKFRYIPNRVSPLEIIKSESDAVKNSLIRRLKAADGNSDLFSEIQKKATTLIGDIGGKYSGTVTDFESIRFATPKSWADLVFEMGFRVAVGKDEVEDEFQGSGAQSIFMIETLKMVDEDFYKRFGWRQATIWAFEEPETSLHHSLSTHVAKLLAKMSANESSKLQILATTHSNLILQRSNTAYLVKREVRTTVVMPLSLDGMLEEAWGAGITPWQHPLLHFSEKPLIIVEGKFDYNLFRVVRGLLPSGLDYRISYLEKIDPVAGTGGTDSLLKYLKNNTTALAARVESAPIIVLLDWDAADKEDHYKKIYTGPGYAVRSWKEADLNPELSATIRGTERALGTNFIKRICEKSEVAWYEAKGKISIHTEVKQTFKSAMNAAILGGPKPDDLKYAISFFKNLVEEFTLD